MTKEGLEASFHTTETLVQVFGFVVAIGIVGEAVFGLRYLILNRRLQALQHLEEQARQAEVAGLNKEAGEARKSAADAHERAANAEERAAHANKKADRGEASSTTFDTRAATPSSGEIASVCQSKGRRRYPCRRSRGCRNRQGHIGRPRRRWMADYNDFW